MSGTVMRAVLQYENLHALQQKKPKNQIQKPTNQKTNQTNKQKNPQKNPDKNKENTTKQTKPQTQAFSAAVITAPQIK